MHVPFEDDSSNLPDAAGSAESDMYFDLAMTEHLQVFVHINREKRVLARIAARMVQTLLAGGKILLFGNGGSAADAQHLAAELVGRFERHRRALAALALTTDTSVITAVANDYGYPDIFRRQVEALGRPGDVLIGLSTSGSSENVCAAFEEGRRLGITSVAMCGGRTTSRAAGLADIVLSIPSNRTARVQEAHIFCGHVLCGLVEAAMVRQERLALAAQQQQAGLPFVVTTASSPESFPEADGWY